MINVCRPQPTIHLFVHSKRKKIDSFQRSISFFSLSECVTLFEQRQERGLVVQDLGDVPLHGLDVLIDIPHTRGEVVPNVSEGGLILSTQEK